MVMERDRPSSVSGEETKVEPLMGACDPNTGEPGGAGNLGSPAQKRACAKVPV